MSSRYNFVEPNPSKTWIDLNLNFTLHPTTKDVTKKTNEAAISQALKNLVFLGIYDKPFHPEIGGNLAETLFENIEYPGVLELIKQKIRGTIVENEPRVELKKIVVDKNTDQNEVIITIFYQIINTLEHTSITIFLKTLR